MDTKKVKILDKRPTEGEFTTIWIFRESLWSQDFKYENNKLKEFDVNQNIWIESEALPPWKGKSNICKYLVLEKETNNLVIEF